MRYVRGIGALALLPIAAAYRAGVRVQAAEFADAAALIEEARVITEVTGTPPVQYPALVLAAWRGDEAATLDLVATGIEDATERGEGGVIALAEYATAVLYNGRGRYDLASAAAQRAAPSDDLGLRGWVLVELIESAVRNETPAVAAQALEELTSARGPAAAIGRSGSNHAPERWSAPGRTPSPTT